MKKHVLLSYENALEYDISKKNNSSVFKFLLKENINSENEF